MKHFWRDSSGVAVSTILILAAISVIVVYFGVKMSYQTKYTSKEKVDANITCTLKEDMGSSSKTNCESSPSVPPSGSSGGGSSSGSIDTSEYLMGKEVFGFIDEVEIIPNPNTPPFIYNENDLFQLKAIPKQISSEYVLKEPLSCKWEGYPDYSGYSCDDTPKVRFPVGEHSIKVTLCDKYGACQIGTKTIQVAYKNPLLVMHQEWTNYKKSGGTLGNWKYDQDKGIIYSTVNDGWTGYYNPSDVLLADYSLHYKMAVVNLKSDDDDVIGMTFRMKDLNNMYLLSIDRRDMNGGVNYYHSGFYRLKGGKLTQLVDLMPTKWVKDQYMDVKIQAVGNRIVIYIDGVKRVDYTDPTPILNGSYGPFTISQANGTFSNLEVEVYK